MFSLTVRRHFMIAHSLPREAFGPAQGLHGATFVAEVTFRRRALNDDAIVLDIGAAGGLIEEVLAGLNYKNLDEHPDFAGKLSTTEALAQYIAEAVAAKIRVGEDGRELAGLDVTLRETPRRLGLVRARLRRRAKHMPGSRADRPAIRLIVPGNVLHNSGGNVYNAALVRGLTALGADVEVWPARRRLAGGQRGRTTAAGRAAARRRQPADAARGRGAGRPVTIVDGLVALGAPLEMEAAAAAGRPAWILLHMPLAAHPDLERTRAGGRRRRDLHQFDDGRGNPGQALASTRSAWRCRALTPPRLRPARTRRTSWPWPRCCRTRTSSCCWRRSPGSRTCPGPRRWWAPIPPTPPMPGRSGAR